MVTLLCSLNTQKLCPSPSQHTPPPSDTPLPQVDTYGTQQPIALLKLLLEKGGMYDREKDLNWKTFKDISYMAAMGKVSRCDSDSVGVGVTV